MCMESCFPANAIVKSDASFSSLIWHPGPLWSRRVPCFLLDEIPYHWLTIKLHRFVIVFFFENGQVRDIHYVIHIEKNVVVAGRHLTGKDASRNNDEDILQGGEECVVV